MPTMAICEALFACRRSLHYLLEAFAQSRRQLDQVYNDPLCSPAQRYLTRSLNEDSADEEFEKSVSSLKLGELAKPFYHAVRSLHLLVIPPYFRQSTKLAPAGVMQ